MKKMTSSIGQPPTLPSRYRYYTILCMDDFLTVKQVAMLLKIHHLTVRRYIAEGKLKAVKLGGNVRITQKDLQSFSESYIPNTKQVKKYRV